MSNAQPTNTPDPHPSTPAGTQPTLADLESASWQQLLTATDDDSHGFHTMTLATCTANGADARTVVLRKVDPGHKYLWFHTDARSPKVIQLEAHPNATLLFWDSKQQLQYRLVVETRLHTDDYVADDQWNELPVSGRKGYLSELKPGSEQQQPYPGFPPALGDALPSQEASEAGRPNFAVIECRVLLMDYLHLSRSGHTRACFQYEPVGQMNWVAP